MFKDIHFIYMLNKEFRLNRELTPTVHLLELPKAYIVNDTKLELVLDIGKLIYKNKIN